LRADKTVQCFQAVVHVVTIIVNSR